MCANGTVRVGADSLEVGGYGLRDHSWGPRSWQAPWFYRWVHGSTAGMGFMGAYFGSPDNTDRRGGFVWDGDSLHSATTSSWPPVGMEISSSSIDLELGRAAQLVLPRRGRRLGAATAPRPGRCESTTRIVESATTWTTADGRSCTAWPNTSIS